jgi:hypothetical protein
MYGLPVRKPWRRLRLDQCKQTLLGGLAAQVEVCFHTDMPLFLRLAFFPLHRYNAYPDSKSFITSNWRQLPVLLLRHWNNSYKLSAYCQVVCAFCFVVLCLCPVCCVLVTFQLRCCLHIRRCPVFISARVRAVLAHCLAPCLCRVCSVTDASFCTRRQSFVAMLVQCVPAWQCCSKSCCA